MSINWVFSWSSWQSTFMSHATPLILPKECIVHCHTMCLFGLVMLPTLLSCHPIFKGMLKKSTSIVKTVFVSVLLSQYCGYYIQIIPELCSKFHVIDVGLIMALLRWDYSCQHQLIIWEIVLETIFSTLRSVCLNDRFYCSQHRFTSLTFDR